MNPNPPEMHEVLAAPENGEPARVPNVQVFDPSSETILARPIPVAVPAAAGAVEGDSVLDLLDVLLVLVATFLSTTISLKIAYTIYSISHSTRPSPALLLQNAFFVIPAQFAGYLIAFCFTAVLIVIRHRQALFRAAKWNAPPRHEVIRWLGLGAALGTFSLASSIVLERWIPKSLPIDELFRSTSAAYLLSAFGIFVAPLVEELFFRGFLFPALAKITGVATSVVVTAVSFALLHSEQLAKAWAPLMVLFVIGTALTLVRARTQSVARCVLVHMGYNTMLFTTMFILTRGFTHLERI